MVITCPSCSARYRLNPDKIKGRGAKITCPKCTHIFVVFSDQASQSTPGAAAPQVPPIAKGPDTAGDLLARRDRELTTGAFKAVGIDVDDDTDRSLTQSGKIRVVAPGPRKARRSRSATTIDSSASMDAIRSASMSGVSVAAGADASLISDDFAPVDIPEPKSASELDFREVGITTWKVKVAIGLIYDFSDISTLKKYLADKKVTEDDLISHDAKQWVRIGEINNLDRHFIETWKIAKAEKLARGSSVKVKKPTSSDTTGDASSRFSATGADSGSGSFANPAAGGLAGSGQTRTRARKRKPKVEEVKKNYTPMILAAVVLVGGLGYFFFGRPIAPAPASTSGGEAATLAPPKDIDEAERERIRQRIREDMEEQRKLILEDETPEEPEERTLLPVLPDDRRVPVQRDRGKLPGLIKPPTARRDPTPAPGRVDPVQDEPEQTPAPIMDSGGKMWFDQAKKKYESGDYGSARSMVLKAIEKDSENPSYQQLLADIQGKLGEN